MLTKPAADKVEADNSATGKLREEETEEDNGAPVTRSFLEGLFTSLRDDIQEVKRDLLQDLKVVCQELEEAGERVATLEKHENARGEEIEQLQQEIIWLQDQQIKLHVHAEDLENWSRRNNIQIRGAPTGAEEEYVLADARAIFHQILGESLDREVCIDRVHRVRPPHVPPADILACIHNVPLKESILGMAREQHPLNFRGHTLLLYMDLAAITLQKQKDFRPFISHLRDKRVPYSWGHPFRLIFRWEGKLHQLHSLKVAYNWRSPGGESQG
ncbi:hypothetical protein NDU88_005245 [Pleurodeles waltl]|uniref:L1 transposable element RRM domain-containing protein n=1 Tax=Pleurodeles waltl TaxID=8319 RepID=A0AAV7WY81_PLEWA|nr:hypothetical protein NDU88_005245 [Pleurodeles waltl]